MFPFLDCTLFNPVCCCLCKWKLRYFNVFEPKFYEYFLCNTDALVIDSMHSETGLHFMAPEVLLWQRENFHVVIVFPTEGKQMVNTVICWDYHIAVLYPFFLAALQCVSYVCFFKQLIAVFLSYVKSLFSLQRLCSEWWKNEPWMDGDIHLT